MSVESPVTVADEAEAALARVSGALPAGEVRPGQIAMARAVAEAVATEGHLMVQAGTGTGKSLAYLVPAICSGRRVVVATATKALQDQLVGKDLPFLERHIGRPFTFTCLKGRSNYLCVQRAREAAGEGGRLELDRDSGSGGNPTNQQVRALIAWTSEQLDRSGRGDRSDLPFEPAPAAWSAVSVSSRECPGANHCPAGDVCFAERARELAALADVVVVNTHLYGTHLAAGGGVLPHHDIVVIDEAHVLADVISATAGIEIAASRFIAVAGALRGILADDSLVAAVADAGSLLSDAIYPFERQRVSAIDGELADAITVGRSRLDRALAALRQITQPPPQVAPRKERALRLVSSLVDDLDAIVDLPPTTVAWVESGPAAGGHPVLRQAPVDIRAALASLFDHETVVLTSATLPATLPDQLGVPGERTRVLDVGSPFDFRANARLYCAVHLPDPRSDAFEAAMNDELAVLIEAAGGRTLALFTSWKRMRTAVDAARARVAFPILAQGDRPKPALVAAFGGDEPTCLFATIGFWQGIDVPGRALSLVTIDRLPFTPPDDPLVQARREAAGPAAFTLIDVPRAATLLAQGTGRLIRTASDRGVVAVLDRRLATGSYRQQILAALPPMRRLVDRDEVVVFLRAITS
ncbi:MAG: ATP-dependent DNA helicase [Acidimicrobiales bacterium]